MLQFILGRAGSGKTTEVFSRVATALHDGKSPVLLVPEQFSFETERAAVERFGMKDAARVQVLSFTRLAERVLRQVGGVAEQVMSDVTRTLLLSRALEIHTAPENAPDGGEIVLQKAVEIEPGDTAETLQRRVMEQAEWQLLPRAAELVCREIAEKEEQ